MEIGTRKIVEYKYIQRDCDLCENPATNKHTFLLENARRNPASSGYGGDDISYCSDACKYACEEHKEEVRRDAPEGMAWCSTFYTVKDGEIIERNMHHVCEWQKEKEEIIENK